MKSPQTARKNTSGTAAKSNLVDPDLRKLFLVHVDAFIAAKAKVDKASNAFRTLKGVIKGDGFKVGQIEDAIWMSTPEGEAEFKADIANKLLAAAYVGAAIGEQLSFFLDGDRTPAVDRAAKEGQAAAMRNEAHAPPYDSSVPQYKAWSDAFYAEQERQVKAGIGKLDAKEAEKNAKGSKAKPAKVAKPAGKRGRPPKKAAEAPAEANGARLITKAEKETKAAARAPKADNGPPRRPAAQPVTRATLAAQKAQAREEADSYFSKAEPKGNA